MLYYKKNGFIKRKKHQAVDYNMPRLLSYNAFQQQFTNTFSLNVTKPFKFQNFCKEVTQFAFSNRILTKYVVELLGNVAAMAIYRSLNVTAAQLKKSV
jgi:hypothetical protein